MSFTQHTRALLRAQQVAQREWRAARALQEGHDLTMERGLSVDAAWTVAHRLGQKALAALQAEEAQRMKIRE